VTAADGDPGSALEQVRRWEDSGGVWRVLSSPGPALEIALLTCDAGEEMARVRSPDPQLRAYVDGRAGSDDPRP
jgi:hypothetical protein